MKNILVTGNEGYIGRVLTEELMRRGYQVVGLDWGIFKDVNFVSVKMKPARQIYKDIRDINLKDLRGIDAVVHLAGIANDPIGDLSPQATYEINHRASVNLAKLAKKAGVKKFLFSSSCSVYGASKKEYVNEDNRLDPQTPYACSKIQAEKDIACFGDKTFAPAFLRNATVFGISPRMRLDLVVQNLVAWGYLYQTINILSDGTPWRPLIHVRDVAEAFCFLLKQPASKILNQVFNVGHKSNNVQVRDIAREVQAVLPKTKVEIKNENPTDRRSYKVDFSKIYALGFRPKYTVLDGIKEIFKIFKKAKLLKKDFKSDKYITLRKYEILIKNKELNSADLRKID